MWPDVEKQQKAQEILRRKKQEWGLSWSQMGQVLGVLRLGSIKAYASDHRLIPQWAIDALFALDSMPNPELDKPEPKKHSGTLILIFYEDRWHTFSIGEIRICPNCKNAFIPSHPQQVYCDTYTGPCGLEMRRKRYAEKRLREWRQKT
jgi:hypothetical protein